MGKGKLHELLAVEPDLEGVYKKLLDEARVTFEKRADHFIGSVKRLELLEDVKDQPTQEPEHKAMVTTVPDKLDYVGKAIARYIDAVYQKERTNQTTGGEINLGNITATAIPATFLLGLETKLKHIRAIYEAIPTLQPGIVWVKDEQLGRGIYKTQYPEVKFKTKKTFMHKVLVDATKEHPAQIEKWEEQVPVGKYITETQSGMLTPAEKSEMLGRIDNLLREVKKARQRANNVDADTQTIGEQIVKYINGF